MKRSFTCFLVALFVLLWRADARASGHFDDAGAGWSPSARTRLAAIFDDALDTAALRSAHVGLVVLDPHTGRTLFAHDADRPVTPASTLKVLTGIAALDRLGPDFTFLTTLETNGTPDADGTLAGDLRLHGGGDPVLQSADVTRAARTLAESGVRRIGGCVTTDASHFDRRWYGTGWMLEDLGSYFFAPVSGLDIDENLVPIEITPGDRPGTAATYVSPPEIVITANRVTTGARGSKDTSDIAPHDDLRGFDLIGSVPQGPAVRLQVAVPDPERHARRVLTSALGAAGIAVDDAAPCRGGAFTIRSWSHRSPPLSTVLRTFWTRSDNLIGETLLKELGSQAGSGTTEMGLHAERSFLTRLGLTTSGMAYDGSGLSRYDVVPPSLLAALLVRAYNGPRRDVVLGALPMLGVRGGLESYDDPALVERLAAKTGNMFHVTGLAGYLATRRHGTVVFAWLDDDFTVDSARIFAVQRQALAALANLP